MGYYQDNRVMKTLKAGIFNKKEIWGFDVETKQKWVDDHIEQVFLMGSVVNNDEEFIFWKLEDMQKFLLSKKLRNAYIFASNLEFDFNHIFMASKYLKEFKVIDHNGIIICRHNDGHGHTRTFLDTMNYLPKSVKALGEMLNIPKLDTPSFLGQIPKDYRERKILEAYNIRDSLISCNFGIYMQDFCNNLGCKFKYTIASIGLDNWRRNYQPYDILQEDRDVLDAYFDGAYRGGRTELFKRGYFEDLHYYDYNSHYPAQCFKGYDNKGSYPDPNSSRYHKGNSQLYDDFEGITRLKFRVPEDYIQPLGILHNDKFCFAAGVFEGWFNNCEIRMALAAGAEILKVYESIYYTDRFTPFRQCISKLYRMRKKYKKEGNDPMQFFTKTLMNSGTYGKFCQKIDKKTEVYSADSVLCNDLGQLYVINKKGKEVMLSDPNIRGSYVFDRIDMPRHIPVFIMPVLSSYTTSLARIKLFEDLKKFKDNVVYCDTDSIFSMKDLGFNSSELGELKLECKVDKALFIKPKFYNIQIDNRDIFKAKGVPRSKVNKDSFADLLAGKKVYFDRFLKTKEAAVRNMPYSSIVKCNKQMDLYDNKRLWHDDLSYKRWGDSRPIVV